MNPENRADSVLELFGFTLAVLLLCGFTFAALTSCATVPTDCEIARDELAAANRCLADAECSARFPLLYIARDSAAGDVARYCGRNP